MDEGLANYSEDWKVGSKPRLRITEGQDKRSTEGKGHKSSGDFRSLSQIMLC